MNSLYFKRKNEKLDKTNENQFIKILLKVMPYSINFEDAEEFYNKELPFLKSINIIFKNSPNIKNLKHLPDDWEPTIGESLRKVLQKDDDIFNKLLIDIAKNGFPEDHDEFSIFTDLLDDSIYENLLDKIIN